MGTTSAMACVRTTFRRPELLLTYFSYNSVVLEDSYDEAHEAVLHTFHKWIQAVGEDCLMEQPFIRHDAVNRLRFADPANLLHLNALSVKSLEAWQKSELLEQSPETLFHIGQVVGSCQSITGSLMGLNSGLVSYL